jgi:hypothetical protein
MRFRAYVNNRAADLSATCNSARPEAECSAPLPPLTDGVHTIELVSILNGESARSASITVEKVSARATVSSSLPLASARGGVRLDTVITLADGLSYTTDVVATGVRAPAQLSWLSDGRLLVAEADGRVRLVRPGERENRDAALDAGMLSSQPLGAMGIASHPDFVQNRFVYVSLLERDRAGDASFRLLRLREVGDTLGEAATLFEAPVAGSDAAAQPGPRMAFGPDRLLYVMLPPGVELANEPAASTPRASMLRLTDEGRASSEPLTGITATPLAFSWSPTGSLWVMFRGSDGAAAVRSLESRARVQAVATEPARLRVREGGDGAASTLLLQSAADNRLVAQALVTSRGDGSRGLARLALPAQGERGTLDRIGDVVAGDGGTLFLATQNAPAGAENTAIDVVVRLRPTPPATAR